MSNRLSYLEESTVEKRQFEQMESKVLTLVCTLSVVITAWHMNLNVLGYGSLSSFTEKRARHTVGYGRII